MTLLVAIALLQPVAVECPVFLRAENYPPTVARLTRPYIDCMTRPDLPYGERLAERRARCAPVREEQLARVEELPPSARQTASRALQADDSFLWVDHVAASLAGCHTNLYLAGDGADFPYAEDR